LSSPLTVLTHISMVFQLGSFPCYLVVGSVPGYLPDSLTIFDRVLRLVLCLVPYLVLCLVLFLVLCPVLDLDFYHVPPPGSLSGSPFGSLSGSIHGSLLVSLPGSLLGFLSGWLPSFFPVIYQKLYLVLTPGILIISFSL
jgi:hypothetical protein